MTSIDPSLPTFGWQTDVRSATVMVLDKEGGVAGAGAVLADGWVVTCAHVLTDLTDPPVAPVVVAFPHLNGRQMTGRVVAELWRPKVAADVAFLRLEEELPAGMPALRVGAAAGARNHGVVSFGFPADGPRGGRHGSAVVGESFASDGGVEQRQLSAAEDITVGFSGAPVVDRMSGLMVGIIDAVQAPDRLGRGVTTAYLTPTETLRSINPALNLSEIRPYVGLDAFGFDQAGWFHGRTDEVDQLVAALRRDNRLVALLGPSGSGKSSLVHAGLLPRLAGGGLPGADQWRWLSARPGIDPYRNLAAAGLTNAAPAQLVNAVTDQLRTSQRVERLVLVIDQFEELFTQTPTGTRRDLLDDLIAVIAAQEVPVTVVLVMRDEFYNRLAATVPDVLHNVVNIPAAVSEASLTAMIERPGAAVGLALEPQLVGRIIADATRAAPTEADTPGAATTVLPLMEFTLTELWHRRREGQLTHQHYTALGGITGGLTRWCDRAYNDLEASLQPLARRLLTALVTPGDVDAGIPPTRRTRTIPDLHASEHPPKEDSTSIDASTNVDSIVDHLADARLLVTGRDTAGVPTVELIHDAIIREWNALQAWLADDRDYRTWRDRLEQQHRDWQAADGDPDLLLRGISLSQALERRTQRPLQPTLTEYIQHSDAAQQRRRVRDRRRTRILAALLAISTAISVVAIERNSRAQTQTRIARAGALAAQSNNVLDTQPELAHLLALEGLRTALIPQSYTSLGQKFTEPFQPSQTLRGHADPVFGVSFSPNGELLASAGFDGTVRLWDPSDGTGVGEPLTGHAGYIREVSFNPDGQLLASAGSDGTVRLWDPSDSSEVGDPLIGHEGSVEAVAFSSDGQLLASAGSDGTVRLWDPSTGSQIGDPLTGHTDIVTGLAFSPDNDLLATVSTDETVRLWNPSSGDQVGNALTGHTDGVNGVAFSPDGELLATVSEDETLRFWDPSSGSEVREALRVHSGRVSQVAFSVDGTLLASVGDDQIVSVLSSSGSDLFTGHSGPIFGVAFSPDGRLLATASGDQTVRLWQLFSGDRVGEAVTGHDGTVWGVAFSPDGPLLASAGDDWTVRLWDPRTGREVGDPLDGHTEEVTSVAFSPDGNLLATASADRTVRLWDPSSGNQVGDPLTGHSGAVWGVTFSPDSRLLASAGFDGAVRLWDPSNGAQVGDPLAGHVGGVEGVAFSPDGQVLATAGNDRTVRLWDSFSGAQIGEALTGHTDDVSEVAFSPDGHLLATVSDDDTVRLWDPSTGSQVGDSLTGHTDDVQSVAFSPDGRLLATVGADSTLRVWDPSSGDQIGDPLIGHAGPVLGVAFSPDGQLLATVGFDQTVRFWASPSAWVELACARAGRNLTQDEWDRYVDGSPYVRSCSEYESGADADPAALAATYPHLPDVYVEQVAADEAG